MNCAPPDNDTHIGHKIMAKQKTGKATPSNSTEIVISGTGVSFSLLDIDHETFVRFTKTGLSSAGFDDLREQLDEADTCITAPFLEDANVTINGKVFHSSWANIKNQCKNKLPPIEKLYAGPAGTYTVYLEYSHRGEFARAKLADFDPTKLYFKIENVHLGKGHEYVLLNPSYCGHALGGGSTSTEAQIYVVDRVGKRHEIAIAGDD